MRRSSDPPGANRLVAMRSWLRRWFGDAAGGAAEPLLGASPTEAPRPVVAASLPAPAGAGEYVQALQLELVDSEPLTEEEQAIVERVAASVKAHFAAERDQLEMLPTSCLRVLNLVARPDLELRELISAAGQDPAIAVALLRFANSAAMGATGREVRTVREAIARLGLIEVSHVAGAVSARVLFGARSKAEQAMYAARRSQLHWCAVTTAAGAARLSIQRHRGRPDHAYLGGMLHDVGKAIALGSLSALTVAGRAPRDLTPPMIHDILEQVHTELGTEALRHWSLPGHLVTLCATHHDPELPDSEACAETHLVRVIAGLLALRADPSDRAALELLLHSARVLQITPLELRALDVELHALASQVGRVLGLGESAAEPKRTAKANA